jgi:beta-lactamase class A
MLLLALSILGNLFLLFQSQINKDDEITLQDKYPYLSKRIFAENPNDVLINFIPLRRAIREYVDKPENKVGLYFEYLPSGTSIGANEKEEFQIVSLSKVPLAMAIYKKIENGNLSKSDTLVVKKVHLNSDFGSLWKKGEGTKLTIKELVELLLIDSDNTAYNVLIDVVTSKEHGEIYEGLDIELTQRGEDLLISPKSYSSIFRSLYLSSVLSEEYSNELLEILSVTPFSDKIGASLPNDIKFSHKIGVFETRDASKNLFTDCGIIYVPNRPYILCIFVKDNEEMAQKHMSEISKMVYKYVKVVRGG